MARQSLIEQLDKASQAILDKTEPEAPRMDGRLATLVRVASRLRFAAPGIQGTSES